MVLSPYNCISMVPLVPAFLRNPVVSLLAILYSSLPSEQSLISMLILAYIPCRKKVRDRQSPCTTTMEQE